MFSACGIGNMPRISQVMHTKQEKLLTAEVGLPHEVIRQQVTGCVA